MKVTHFGHNSDAVTDLLIEHLASYGKSFVVDSDTSLSWYDSSFLTFTFTGSGFGRDEDGRVTGTFTSFQFHDEYYPDEVWGKVELAPGQSIDLRTFELLAGNAYFIPADETNTDLNWTTLREMLYGDDGLQVTGSEIGGVLEGSNGDDVITSGGGPTTIVFSLGSGPIDFGLIC